jgi:hypothetical protein
MPGHQRIKTLTSIEASVKRYGRGEWIRTTDLRDPNAALYQAEPRPVCVLVNGAEGGSRTHTGLPPAVFETAASAIPPLRPNQHWQSIADCYRCVKP